MSPTLVVVLALAGFAAGVIDAIAGGGGLITLPALMAAGLPPHLAIATNKGQAVFGATTSFASFWSRGAIDKDRVLLAFASGLIGSFCGARVLLAVRPEPLKPVIVVLLVIAAALVVVRKPAPSAKVVRHPRAALVAIALTLGAYDGFFGPGVGSMLIVAFATVFGDSLTRASGNAKVVNLASNLAAVTLFATHGNVMWTIALPMAAANAAGAFVGARLAVARGDRFVRVVLLVVVFVLVLKISMDLLQR